MRIDVEGNPVETGDTEIEVTGWLLVTREGIIDEVSETMISIGNVAVAEELVKAINLGISKGLFGLKVVGNKGRQG